MNNSPLYTILAVGAVCALGAIITVIASYRKERMNKQHDINKAIVKITIEWNKNDALWHIRMFRSDGSSTALTEYYMQNATDKIQRIMESENNWPE